MDWISIKIFLSVIHTLTFFSLKAMKVCIKLSRDAADDSPGVRIKTVDFIVFLYDLYFSISNYECHYCQGSARTPG